MMFARVLKLIPHVNTLTFALALRLVTELLR